MIIRTSFSLVTPESAEHGDFADTGWEDEEGFDCREDPEIDPVEAAVFFLEDQGAIEYSSGPGFSPDGWYSSEPIEDLLTGEEKTFSFHLSGFSVEDQEAIYDAIIGG